MSVYYNENDPFAAQWLRTLIVTGQIAPGDVDERSIEDVRPDDLAGYTQCHFFAGIGGWSYALRLAGWPDDRPVWTGSCPCQPFSAAGARGGVDDPRHLWPHWRWLVAQRSPATVFGEQVASKDGRRWFAGVRADLEALDYAVGCADLCAAGAGAPHIRQRLFWMADSHGGESREAGTGRLQPGGEHRQRSKDGCTGGRLADAAHADGRTREFRSQEGIRTDEQRRVGLGECGTVDRLVDSDQPGPQGRALSTERPDQCAPWSTGVAIPCSDGRSRRIEPGSFPLAHGVPGRVGRLRGYGNAIVPQVAAIFIKASANV